MRNFLVSIVAIVFTAGTGHDLESAAATFRPLPGPLKAFLMSDYTLVTNVADIAEPVRLALFARMRHDPRLANPGAEFNATDVVDTLLPMRRLIVSGRSAASSFICYEHGGSGYHQQLVVLALDSSGPRLIFSGRFTVSVSSFADLKKLVKNGLVPDETEEAEEHGYY